PALPQGPLAVGEAALVGPVLDFDANGAGVAAIRQSGEELAPLHVAEAGELGVVPVEAVDADVVQLVVINAFILGVDVDDLFSELADGPRGVDELPDQVRRVEIQADGAREDFEERAPGGGADGEVLAAGPFVGAEKHGAVL